jgi:AcrR family transcriptional regulator
MGTKVKPLSAVPSQETAGSGLPAARVEVGLRGYRVIDSERSAARRREILHAAARVFATRGYYTSTTDDIARAMGVTKGVIYYYFRSKEEIYFEVVSAGVEGALRRLEITVADDAPAVETLHRAVTDLVTFNVSEQEEGYYAMLVIHDMRALSVENLGRVRDLQRSFRALFVDILQRGVDEGVFIAQDAGVAANAMLNAANYVADWFRPSGRLSAAEVARQIADQLVRGVLQPESLAEFAGRDRA